MSNCAEVISLRCPHPDCPREDADEFTVSVAILGSGRRSAEAIVFGCSEGCQHTDAQLRALEQSALDSVLA